MSVPNPKVLNPKDIFDIKDEKYDREEHERRYPKNKQTHCIERKVIKPKDGLMLEVGQSINDIPLEQRHRYMWIIPDEMKDHPCYKEKDWGTRMIREDKERIKKEDDDKKKKERDKEEDRDRRERDREKKEQDKDDKIEMLLKYVADLGKQVNELTKQMKK